SDLSITSKDDQAFFPKKENEQKDDTRSQKSGSISSDGRRTWFLEPELWGRSAMTVATLHILLLVGICMLSTAFALMYRPPYTLCGEPIISALSEGYPREHLILHRIFISIACIPLPFIMIGAWALRGHHPNFLWPIALLYSMSFSFLIAALVFFGLQTTKVTLEGSFMEFPCAFSPFVLTAVLMLYTQHGCRVMMCARADMQDDMLSDTLSTCSSFVSEYQEPKKVPM
ncbi:hypothetical protein PFISCL1PPCAC_25909, partial [Pristionchus fissidentatus]